MKKKSNHFRQNVQLYARLMSYVKRFFWLFMFSLLGYFLFASTRPIMANLVKYFVDGLVDPAKSLLSFPLIGEVQFLTFIPLALLVITAFQGITYFIGSYTMSKISLLLIQDLRKAFFDKLLTLPNYYFDNHTSGRLLSKLTYDISLVTSAATDSFKVLIREGFTVIMVLGYLIWMNWRLTLLLFIVIPFIAILVRLASVKFRKLSRKAQSSMGDMTHVVTETIHNNAVVRGFAGEVYEKKRFDRAIEKQTHQELSMRKAQAIYVPSLQFVNYIGMAIMMYFVLRLRGDSSIGDLVAYITAAGLLPKPIKQLSAISSSLQRGLAGAESLFTHLDEPSEKDTGTLDIERVQGKIDIKDLSFSYLSAKQPVLSHINLEIKPGEMIALVGRSGSGKTTLANLIPRFYCYNQGTILLDGVPITDYTLASLRKQVAIVNQQVQLFNDTVYNNIAYGDLKNLPKEQVLKAAEAAYATKFINELPQGFETVVGENGVTLSGGQRQRIAIARAILKNAPILILDEATSALDTESERHIQQALDYLMQGRTTLVIAHRLSTIEHAHKILVMDKGQIVESGTHEQLLSQNGAYASLHASKTVENMY